MSDSIIRKANIYEELFLPNIALARVLDGYIKARRPVSAIRLGDGEGKILGYPKSHNEAVLRQQCEFWFGEHEYTIDDLYYLRSLLTKAIMEADIIGMPSMATLNERLPNGSLSLNSHARRALYDNIPVGPYTGKTFGSCMFHLGWQRSGILGELLAGLPFCGLISYSSEAAALLNKKLNIQKVDFYPIPGERYARSSNELALHFPDRFEEILKTLEIPFEGAVFLVAAGPLGKYYCTAIKRRGGIGLDIGCVVDGWCQNGRVNIASKLQNKEYSIDHLLKASNILGPKNYDDIFSALRRLKANKGDSEFRYFAKASMEFSGKPFHHMIGASLYKNAGKRDTYSKEVKRAFNALQARKELNIHQAISLWKQVLTSEPVDTGAVYRILRECDDPNFMKWAGDKFLYAGKLDLALAYFQKYRGLKSTFEVDYLLECTAQALCHESLLKSKQNRYHLISLGNDCLPRTVATYWGLKPRRAQGEKTCPFDLAITPVQSMLKLLDNGFEGYLDPNNFARVEHKRAYAEFVAYSNSLYDIHFSHERNARFEKNNYEDLIKLYRARITNFNDYLASGRDLIFVMNVRAQFDAEKLFELLLRRSASPVIRLVVIHSGYKNIGFLKDSEFIRYIHNPIPTGYRWPVYTPERALMERPISEAILSTLLTLP